MGFFLVVLIGTVFAESEIPGLIRSGQYSQGTLGSVNQPGQIQQTSDGMYSVGAYPLYTPELAQGEGREIIQIFCRFCHSTTYITMQPPLPAATWESVVNKMSISTGPPFLKILRNKSLITCEHTIPRQPVSNEGFFAE